MGHIRIMLADVPRMLTDILQNAIAQEPDLETVAALSGGEDPRFALARLRPDIVVLGASSETGELGPLAISRVHPKAHIVTLSANGRRAAIHPPGDRPVTLDDASPEVLLRVLRCLVLESQS
jgi:DNA-binding NarL/FixJ family response regulator